MYIIIAGCSALGAELARVLVETGDEVVVVDRNPDALESLGPAFGGITVEGAPMDVDVLAEAGIGRADALVAVTDSDQLNLMIGQVATKVFGLSRVVVQVSDPQLEEAYRDHGMTTYRPGKSGLGQLRILLDTDGISLLSSLGTGEVQIIQFAVRPELAGHELNRLSIPGKFQLVGIVRGGSVVLPTADMRIEPEDRILAAVRLDARAAVTAWVRPQV